MILTTTSSTIWKRQQAWKAFAQTEVGRLFIAYENLTARAWQLDGNDRTSDKRLSEAWDRANEARSAFLRAIGFGP